MPEVLFQDHPVFQLQQSDAICHISPQQGARLLDWKIGSTQIIHWPADADWTNVAHVRGGNPILFPFVGRHMADGEIGYWKDAAGTVRALPMHGFARDLPFEVIATTPNFLHMRLTSSEITRPMYPFEFEFDVIYELDDTSLKSTFVTHNSGDLPLPYYAGHHFYLDIPHHQRAQWQVQLPCNRWGWQSVEDGSIKTKAAASTQTTLADTAIIDRFHLEFSEPKVLLTDGHKTITFSWSALDPWFDVTTWTRDAGADFYCVEPWLGLPNAIHHGIGLRELAAGATEKVSCVIVVD